MTAREELDKILFPGGDALGPFWLTDTVMDWHAKHRPQVTREAVSIILHSLVTWLHINTTGDNIKRFDGDEFQQIRGRVVDDLLVLLNGEKKWCEHLKYDEGWVFDSQGTLLGSTYTKTWTVCPICGAKRP